MPISPQASYKELRDPVPAEATQIEQLTMISDLLRNRAALILDGLRGMRNAAFGPHPEAVDSNTQVKPAGAIDILRSQLHDTADTLEACETVLGEVRRII